jgi:hypothetical protein
MEVESSSEMLTILPQFQQQKTGTTLHLTEGWQKIIFLQRQYDNTDI